MPYATVPDVEGVWRSLSDAEKVLASNLLEVAEVKIDAECPPADPLTDEAQRRVVSMEMVKRAMLAGADSPPIENTAMTAGPFNRSVTYANPMGDLYLTKADRKLLGIGRQRAFTVSMWPAEEVVT